MVQWTKAHAQGQFARLIDAANCGRTPALVVTHSAARDMLPRSSTRKRSASNASSGEHHDALPVSVQPSTPSKPPLDGWSRRGWQRVRRLCTFPGVGAVLLLSLSVVVMLSLFLSKVPDAWQPWRGVEHMATTVNVWDDGGSERARSSSRVLVVYIALASVADSASSSPPAHNIDFYFHWGERRRTEQVEDSVLVIPRLTTDELRNGYLGRDSVRSCRYLAAFYPQQFAGRIVQLDDNDMALIPALLAVLDVFGGAAAVTKTYKSLVVVTDEVRGPFIPNYLRHGYVGWEHLFTSLLRPVVGGVHLVTSNVWHEWESGRQVKSIEPGVFAVDTRFGLPAVLSGVTAAASSAAAATGTADTQPTAASISVPAALRQLSPAALGALLHSAIVSGPYKGKVGLVNFPAGSHSVTLSRPPSGFDTMFARTVAPRFNTTRLRWESNLLVAARAWRGRGMPGMLPQCPLCAQEPLPSLSPLQWRDWLVSQVTPDTRPDSQQWSAGEKPESIDPEPLTKAVNATGSVGSAPKDFLCMYVFAGISPGAMENFLFFLTFGIDPDSANIDYVIILIDVHDRKFALPEDLTNRLAAVSRLSNVHVFSRSNVALDFCSYREAFTRLGGLDAVVRLYKYFLFINDTVRGPFLPAYVTNSRSPRLQKWYRLFVSTIVFSGGDVKLSGCYLSAEIHRHVQSMVFALDQQGVRIVQDAFQCFVGKLAVIRNGEIGMSGRVLEVRPAAASMMSVRWFSRRFCVFSSCLYVSGGAHVCTSV